MNDQKTIQATEDRAERKPYRKPAFEYEEIFETMALTCGKLPSGGGPCQGSGGHSS
jgi:hypothetical protein